MKPRRLQRLTIFSMRWVSIGVFIIFATDEHRLTRIQTRELQWREIRRLLAALIESGQREIIPPSVFIRVNLWLTLRFDVDLGLHRVRDEALVMGAMIHLLNLLRSRLFIAREFEPLPQRYPRNRQFALRIFLHNADRFIDIFIQYELLFARDRKERKHVTARKRCHKCLLRIDQLWVTQVSRCSRCLHFVSASKFPGVITRIFLILERLIAALPGESDV